MTLSLKKRLVDIKQGIYLICRADLKLATIKNHYKKRFACLHNIEYDNVIIYDIQDESSRTNQAYSVSLKKTVTASKYSHLLRNLSAHDVITNKSVP